MAIKTMNNPLICLEQYSSYIYDTKVSYLKCDSVKSVFIIKINNNALQGNMEYILYYFRI